MKNIQRTDAIDRRLFLGAGALTLGALTSLPDLAWAQAPGAGEAGAKQLSRLLAEFIAGFDLKNVPPEVIDRARVAFIDTMGVMLAGSREEVAHLAVEMVKLEGATPTASIVGQSLRASPQLAALANGVAAHAMDYDFTFLSGQSVSPVIPAILPLAETYGRVACRMRGRLHRRLRGRGAARARKPARCRTTVAGTRPAPLARSRRRRLAPSCMKLPAEKIPDVLGISVSLASGVAVNYGTMTKPLHSGQRGAQRRDGRAARRAAASPRMPRRSRARRGFFKTFARGLRVSLEPFKDLGSR